MINTLQTPFIVFPPHIVTSKIIVKEINLKSEDNTSSNLGLVARGGPYVNKNTVIILRFCKCGKPGHVRYKCSDGEMSLKRYESNAINVSLAMGGDDILKNW
jgi:hypothetical protein